MNMADNKTGHGKSIGNNRDFIPARAAVVSCPASERVAIPPNTAMQPVWG